MSGDARVIRSGLAPTAPAKLFDVDLGAPLHDLDGLDGYVAARALVWLHGTPIGWAQVPIDGEVCSADAIADAVREQLGWPVLRHLLGDALQGESRPPDVTPADLASVAHPEHPGPWPLVTVAVCTRDRAANLAVCLEALRELDYPHLDLLVVDNAPSSDTTRRLVEERFPAVRYACEPRPGLDWARNRAIHEALGEIVAYTDDDVAVHPGWARAIAACFGMNPEVMAVTGLVVAYELETESQALFERYGGFSRGFERRWYRTRAGEAAAKQHGGSGKFGTGANMAYRRRLFDEIGGFDPALDVGTATNGGGDLEMFFRVLKHGHVLAYEPAAVVRHRHRSTYPELHAQIGNNGIGFYAHLARTADVYPEERRAVLRLGLWWLWAWSSKRFLLSFLRPSRIPRELASTELIGSLRGPGRYRQARHEVERVVARFGAVDGLEGGVPAGASSSGARTHGTARVAVRSLDLSAPFRPLTGLAAYTGLRVYVSVSGWVLGYADIDNQRSDVSVARLAEALVDGLSSKVLGARHTGEPLFTFHELVAAAFDRLPAFAGLVPVAPARLASHFGVSIVVATLDRPDDLGRCLTALGAQRSTRPVEVVVVDNNPSSGLTPPVVAGFPDVRLVSEARPGLSYARNRGIAASREAIIATTDDDVTVPPDWLEHLVAPFGDPEVMIVTGNVLPLELDTEAQRLFERYGGLGRGFERRRYDGRWFEWFGDRAVPTWDLGATANAAFRAEVFAHPDIGLLDEALGAGTPTGCSEDTYLFYKVLKAGYAVVYEPAAHVWHRHRRDMAGLQRQLHDYSAGHVAYHLTTLTRDGDLRSLVRLFKHLPIWRARQLARAVSGRSGYPVELCLAETAGNLAGPLALWRSRRRVRRDGCSDPYVIPSGRVQAKPEGGEVAHH